MTVKRRRRSIGYGALAFVVPLMFGLCEGAAAQGAEDTASSLGPPIAARNRELRMAMASHPSMAETLPKLVTVERGIFFYTAALVDLRAGARRGKVSYPLYKGTLERTGAGVYFVLAEASDREFASAFGVPHVPRLGAVHPEGVEEGTRLVDGERWIFPQDPGLVVRLGTTGEIESLAPNPAYSPLKRLEWKKDREVIVNVPFVKWGDDRGQSILIDRGECDPLIRKAPPSRFLLGQRWTIGGGPEGCEGQEDPLARYRGGQALDIKITGDVCPGSPHSWKSCGWITMKLHQTTYRPEGYAYISVFSASQAVVAEQLGVPHTPKLASAGRSNASPPLRRLPGSPGGSEGVSAIVEFHNGVATPSGGPAGFQPGVISYAEPTWSTYSPILHVTWAFFDCQGSRQHVFEDRNVSFFGVTAQEGSGIEGFDPAKPLSFNPFGMRFWNTACPQIAARLAGRPDGTVYQDRLFDLYGSGAVMVTDSPAGWVVSREDAPSPADHKSGRHLVLNAPAPVAVIRR